MKPLIATILMLFLFLNSLAAEIIITPEQWEFGTIDNSRPVEKKIAIENPGMETMRLRLISTCSCLHVQPDTLTLSGGETGTVRLRYEPFEDSGEVRMMLIVVAEGEGDAQRCFFNISGIVDSSQAAEPEEEAGGETPGPADSVRFSFYYDHGCRGCLNYLVQMIYKLQDELDIKLRVTEKDIRDPDVYAEYLEVTARLHAEEGGFPALLFEDVVLHGKDEIERKFGEILKGYLQRD